jgi:anti-anti-sigma factor
VREADRTFDHVLTGEVEHVMVDLNDVTFIDSTGIGCLLHGAFKADKKSVTFEVIPGRAVERFVEVCGLSPYLAGHRAETHPSPQR